MHLRRKTLNPATEGVGGREWISTLGLARWEVGEASLQPAPVQHRLLTAAATGGARHTGSLPISSLVTFVESRGTASQSGGGGPMDGGGRATQTEARRRNQLRRGAGWRPIGK